MSTTRLRSVTINKWIRREIVPINRQAKLLGVLTAKKRISFNHDEPDIRWKPRIARRTPTAGTVYPHEHTFTSIVRHVDAVLSWRVYKMGEYISKIEKLIGRSRDTAFVSLVGNIVKWALDDFKYHMQRTVYYDGTANELSGLEAIVGAPTAIQGSTCYGTPLGSYAGLSRVLGATGLGGNWTGTWPEGDGDPQYCAWSPVVTSYTRSGVSGETTPTWANSWQEAIRACASTIETLTGESPDVVIITPAMYRTALNSLKSAYQLEVTKNSAIVNLGINTRQFDGAEIVVDPFCPANTGWCLCTNHLELWSMQDQLIKTETDEDLTITTEKIGLDFFGNMRCDSPIYVGKLVALNP